MTWGGVCGEDGVGGGGGWGGVIKWVACLATEPGGGGYFILKLINI